MRGRISVKDSSHCLFLEIVGPRIVAVNGCFSSLVVRSMDMLSTVLLAASMVAGQADNPNVPEDAIKAIGYYVGDWRSEWTEDGEKCVDEFRVKWVRGRYCTILTGTAKKPESVSQSTLLSGWDALNKEIVDFSYASDGSHSIERWKILSPTVEEAQSTGVNAQGQPTESVFRIEKKTQDAFILKITNRKEGGESKPDLVFEYNRLKKPAKSAKK